MADLHTATIIADVDLLDTVEFPVRKGATTGLLRGTFAKLKTYLKAGLKMTDFSDVDITTPPTDGQALIWNVASSKFKPGSVTSGGGGGGGSGTVNPTVVQYGSAIGATGAVTLGAAPTPGNLLVAVGSHYSNGATVNAGWTQLVSTNGAVNDGVILATKVVTADDTATVTPYGNFNSAGVSIFEIKDWNGAVFQPFNYKQEVAGTSVTLNLGIPITGSLVVGMTETVSANAAPSSITGATAGTTVTGVTTSASPRQVTPFSKANVTKGTSPVVANYAVSANQYIMGVVICPDQVGASSSGGSTPTIRSSNIQAYNSASVVVPLPAGTAVGDLVIVNATNGFDWNAILPTDWTLLGRVVSSWEFGVTIAKIMTSADITAGSVTVTFGGSFNGTASAVSIIGAVGIVDTIFGGSNGSGSVATQVISGLYKANTHNLILTFTAVRGAMNITMSNHTQLQLVNAANASAYLGSFDTTHFTALGMNETATYPVGGNNGDCFSAIAISG